MLEYVLLIAITMVFMAFILNFYRLIVGPTTVDRVLALDTCYINSIALIVLVSMYLKNSLYYEIAILIALMGFVATVATSKYLLRGDIIE
jgi:multicomponent K+:H+ antiporter subunit F